MKHTTIGLVVTLALGLLTAPLCAEAQQPGKIPRVGVLSPFISSADLLLETFRQGLREIGYMEGQNIAIEYRSAEGRTEARFKMRERVGPEASSSCRPHSSTPTEFASWASRQRTAYRRCISVGNL